ncbi:unnamed protein product [marine sediment metagenome]|uniref:KOW domain-containing protein n=1 Tax=marine sediment metagenome TaxID=412755 RepID=X0V0N8_9ZZZZ
MKFKIGDTVKITAGKDKGREGKIQKVFPKSNKVLVEGINIYKKHLKGKEGVKSGIYELSRPLPTANIALICPSCKKQTRIGYRVSKTQKSRICRKCKKAIEVKK